MRRLSVALVAFLLAAPIASPAGAAVQPPRERERWASITVDEFTILGNVPDRELRDAATRTLRLRDALAMMTTLRVHSPLPTKIYVFADERSFVPYRDAANGRVSENTAGVFLPRSEGNYVLMVTSRLDSASHIIQHELTHHFLRSTIPEGVPLWFSEGLAEFYSTFETVGDAINVGRPRDDHLQFLRSESLLPAAKLFSIDENSTEYNEGVRRGVFYAEAWMLVHDLMLGTPGRAKQVGTFLTQIANGVPSPAAFRAAFGMSDEEVDRELRRYLRQPAFNYTRLTSADFRNAPAIPAAAVLTRDDELASLGDLLVHCTPAAIADGEAFLNEALRLNPKHAGATASLALVNVLRNRRSEADALYVRAVELGTKEWLAYAFAADSLLDHVSPSSADLLKARALYEKAMALNPGAAHAYAGYGMTFVGGDGDPKSGIAALEKAVKLDPRDVDSFANLALLYLHNGRRADAAKLIDGPLAEAGDRRVRVRDALLTFDANDAIEQIRAGRTAEGTEALTRIMPEVHDPAVRAQVEELLCTVQSYTRREDQAREYNRAVSFAVSRKWSEALAIVDRLLPEVKDAEMAAKIREFRKQVLEAKKRLK